MHTFIKRTLWGVAIAGGITFLGATTANAAEPTTGTSGEEGILSGTQLEAPIEVPINIVDNAISLLGTSNSEAARPAPTPAAETAPAPAPAEATPTTDGANGIASGTQAFVEAVVPVTVTNNAIAVLGESSSAAAAAPAVQESAAATTPTEMVTDGGDSLLGGTQAVAPISVPVSVTGNAISVLGESGVEAAESQGQMPASSEADNHMFTNGGDSLLSGTQASVPVDVPVNVTGNAISLLGESSVIGGSSDAGTASTPSDAPVDMVGSLTTGLDSVLGGSQVALPISIPLTISGNSIGLIGESTVTEPAPVATPDPTPGEDTDPTPGEDTDPTPGEDTGEVPGAVSPGILPAADPGQMTPTNSAALTAMSSEMGDEMLADTGGAGSVPLGLASLLLLGAGALLMLRRRQTTE